ncbi:uncharacterized protein LOC142983492 [Anticarsia gemmatalis]|uniref:uncharacterized protein LOC142983492 n=1 Tax=Anticarsia gemmatalis TaxID=129554 RepID=UPI003F759F62
MLREVLLFNLILCPLVIPKRSHKSESESEGDLGGFLVSSLRNDANLDLDMDEEYEDLRAELLAYHTALASLAGEVQNDGGSESEGAPAPGPDAVPPPKAPILPSNTRRSMKSTACWQMGGICVNHLLCSGYRFLTEVPGCKDHLEVCCFTWNQLETRDHRENELSNLAFPWSIHYEFGGEGVVGPVQNKTKKKKKKTEVRINKRVRKPINLPKKKAKRVKVSNPGVEKTKRNKPRKDRKSKVDKPVVLLINTE